MLFFNGYSVLIYAFSMDFAVIQAGTNSNAQKVQRAQMLKRLREPKCLGEYSSSTAVTFKHSNSNLCYGGIW
jgi:hypothetical protein